MGLRVRALNSEGIVVAIGDSETVAKKLSDISKRTPGVLHTIEILPSVRPAGKYVAHIPPSTAGMDGRICVGYKF